MYMTWTRLHSNVRSRDFCVVPALHFSIKIKLHRGESAEKLNSNGCCGTIDIILLLFWIG